MIGTGMLPLHTVKHPMKKSGDEEEISDNLNHKSDDHKRYPGKLELHNISDGQVGNTHAIVPQGVKMVKDDPEQNHQPSPALLKHKNTGIKKNLLARNRLNNLKAGRIIKINVHVMLYAR